MRRWRPWPYISIMPCSRRLAWHESISQIFVFFLLEFSIKFYPSTSIIPFFVCCYVNQPPIFCTIYSFFTFFSAQEPEKCRIAPSALPSIRSPAHCSPDRIVPGLERAARVSRSDFYARTQRHTFSRSQKQRRAVHVSAGGFPSPRLSVK